MNITSNTIVGFFGDEGLAPFWEKKSPPRSLLAFPGFSPVEKLSFPKLGIRKFLFDLGGIRLFHFVESSPLRFFRPKKWRLGAPFNNGGPKVLLFPPTKEFMFP